MKNRELMPDLEEAYNECCEALARLERAVEPIAPVFKHAGGKLFGSLPATERMRIVRDLLKDDDESKP